MYTLIEELARDRQRALLKEAAAWRLARATAGEGGTMRPVWARRGALRRTAGRWLIAAGARVAGAAVTVGYQHPAAGRGAR